MINITFRPDKTKIRKDGRVQIYMHLTKSGKRTKIALPLRVELKHWSDSKQKALPKATEALKVNTELTNYRKLVESNCDIDMPLSQIKDIVKNGEAKELLLIDYIDKFQDSHKYLKSKNYLEIFTVLRKNIKKFDEHITVKNFSYNEMTKFHSFLANEISLKDTTITTLITCLKVVIRYVLDSNLPIDHSALKFTFTAKPQENISLNLSDIEKIKTAILPYLSLRKQRDVLLFACETGQRQSDREILSKKNIKQDDKGRWYLDFIMVKTKTRCVVPLSELALSILKEYEFNLPVLKQRETNRQWKEVCEYAGLTEDVQKISYTGGERISESIPKYQLVSTHTARRTFATLVYNRTKNIKLVSKLLGHASINTTSKYLKLDDDEIFGAFE